jgi:holo-[acyl-carrier protein] synthase
MIYGVGIDLVHLGRMETVLERWEGRFIERVFTGEEIEFCNKRAFPAPCFALCFAVKEAFSKAIGLGMKGGIRWRDIELFHYKGGKPGLKLTGRASDICRGEKITGFHVSLSDEGDYGVAMVVLETMDETGQSV